ncbi:VOC family protein [Williamsia muralis]|uniref:VOC domain-containing protein n=1 Tax=Williamsia marianensis TaxID=85044 RepID=A0A2G3PKB2_WILMA|nr:VOC family protein [Williamsia marianensis]PHV66163.1 hypothetical protein CSW57_21330 [Williamsia marianensis]
MIWHVAFSVDDLEEAMEKFGDALQVEWNPIKHYVGESMDADGKLFTLDTRLVFSAQGPVALELFENVPGTPNEPASGTIFHHMGYWTDNVNAEQDRLRECNWMHKGGKTVPESRAAFFSGPLGIFFEACNSSIERPGLGKYYPGVAPGMNQPDRVLKPH